MSTVVRKLKAKDESSFSSLKCNNIGATDSIKREPWKNSRNNDFRSKQTKKKAPPNIFRRFEVRRKVQLTFWTPKNRMKDECYVLGSYKQRNKVY